eukprot:SAG31_NODE_1171_length_9560_cov_11.668745_3_plen_333_part_00
MIRGSGVNRSLATMRLHCLRSVIFLKSGMAASLIHQSFTVSQPWNIIASTSVTTCKSRVNKARASTIAVIFESIDQRSSAARWHRRVHRSRLESLSWLQHWGHLSSPRFPSGDRYCGGEMTARNGWESAAKRSGAESATKRNEMKRNETNAHWAHVFGGVAARERIEIAASAAAGIVLGQLATFATRIVPSVHPLRREGQGAFRRQTRGKLSQQPGQRTANISNAMISGAPARTGWRTPVHTLASWRAAPSAAPPLRRPPWRLECSWRPLEWGGVGGARLPELKCEVRTRSAARTFRAHPLSCTSRRRRRQIVLCIDNEYAYFTSHFKKYNF